MEHAGKGVEIVHAYSAYDAKKILKERPGIALVILDVMMESDEAGLDFVRFLREEVDNKDTRVLLYTGQSGIAPKREVSDKYIIDGYLDKNVADNDDCYVAVRLALKSYEQRLELNESSKKDDVTLLGEIAEVYAHILKDSEQLPIEYERVSEKVNSILHLTQEILASYVLEDLKNNLKLGTTKMQRLSREEYTTLVSIRHIKIILAHTSVQDYERDKDILLNMIVREAQKFALIKILPNTARASLESCLLCFTY
jgi:CheY-like chemotaxis protein